MKIQGSCLISTPLTQRTAGSHVLFTTLPALLCDVERTTNPATKTVEEVMLGLGFKGWMAVQMLQITVEREGLMLLAMGPS